MAGRAHPSIKGAYIFEPDVRQENAVSFEAWRNKFEHYVEAAKNDSDHGKNFPLNTNRCLIF